MNGFTFSPPWAGSPADCWRPGSPYWPFSKSYCLFVAVLPVTRPRGLAYDVR